MRALILILLPAVMMSQEPYVIESNQPPLTINEQRNLAIVAGCVFAGSLTASILLPDDQGMQTPKVVVTFSTGVFAFARWKEYRRKRKKKFKT